MARKADWVVVYSHHTAPDKERPWTAPFDNKTDAVSYAVRLEESLGRHYRFRVARLGELDLIYQEGFYWETAS